MNPAAAARLVGSVILGLILMSTPAEWAAQQRATAQDEAGRDEAVVRQSATDPENDVEVETVRALPNVPLPTLGGRQFWTDHRWDDDWRLQQNALTGHWRLLSPSGVRRAWGTRAACERAMAARVDATREPDTHLIVLVHGLLRSPQSMVQLRNALAESGSARPVLFGYASTRSAIGDHAAALREWVESLPGRPRIDFVAHSMGNIIVRRAIADWQRRADPQEVLPRLGRMVMLGPPNQGADIARRLGKLGLFKLVTGLGAMELGPSWETLEGELAMPPCPFAIVAGDLTGSWMQNPLVEGPSDFLVRVAETRLEGCAEFHTVPVLHAVLMNDKEVQKIVSDFLQQ